MHVQQNVQIILTRFNARKFDARVAREELTSLVDYTDGVEKERLQRLIRVFRRPGFDTPQFKAALANFKSPPIETKEVTS